MPERTLPQMPAMFVTCIVKITPVILVGLAQAGLVSPSGLLRGTTQLRYLRDHAYRWLIHNRSGIFSEDLDRAVEALGVVMLKTPVRAPKANAYGERLNHSTPLTKSSI